MLTKNYFASSQIQMQAPTGIAGLTSLITLRDQRNRRIQLGLENFNRWCLLYP